MQLFVRKCYRKRVAHETSTSGARIAWFNSSGKSSEVFLASCGIEWMKARANVAKGWKTLLKVVGLWTNALFSVSSHLLLSPPFSPTASCRYLILVPVPQPPAEQTRSLFVRSATHSPGAGRKRVFTQFRSFSRISFSVTFFHHHIPPT